MAQSEEPLFPPENRDQFFMHIDSSMCQNAHRVVDELHRLTILRTLHSPDSPHISPCDFSMLGDFQGKLKDRHLQGPEEILKPFPGHHF
jgi:hypothetical protein